MPALRTIGRAIAERPLVWAALSAGLLALYYLVLFGSLLLRFGVLPNYVVWHDVAGNFGNILAGAASWPDRLTLLADEPWFETGYRNPDYYNLAEWSFLLMPGRLLVMPLVAAMLASFMLLRLENPACAQRRPVQAAAGLGAAMLGVASASLYWVVCCGAPSWIAFLAVLGLSTSAALAIEPYGIAVAAFGFALLGGALLHRASAVVTPRRIPS